MTSEGPCPAHYRIPDAECPGCGCDLQPVDLIKSLDGLTFNVVKYAVRAGNKPGEPALKDWAKCLDYVNLAIDREKKRQKRIESGPVKKPARSQDGAAIHPDQADPI